MDNLHPELLAAVKGSQECLEDLQRIAACLPQGDAELATCLEWLVDNRLKFEFDRVLHAALAVRRAVDVQILEKDMAMLGDANWVVGLASKCKGDVGGFLLRLARLPRFVLSFRATLLIAASCYTEGTNPPVTKQELVDETRRLLPLLSKYSSKTPAASQTNDAMAMCALCQVLGLPLPLGSIRIKAKGRLPGRSKEESARELVVDKALECLHRTVNLVRYPAERLVAPTRDKIPPTGSGRTTGKGGQEKVGRNDPCPCNSGKKYKRCCMDQRESDEKVAIQQARDNSASLGVAEDALSLQIVRTASIPFLSRLDPERLPTDLRHAVVDRLVHLRDVVGALRFWKRIRVTEDMDDIYVRALREALLQQDMGLLRELAGLVEQDRLDSLLDCLPARLALIEPTPAAQAAMIETEVARVLGDPVEMSNLAVGLARWKMPALGLALERAALTSGVDAKHARALAREIAGVREVLGLAPGDPSDSLVARLLDREQEQSELARELEEQRGQVHRMLAREKRYAEEVSRLQADLETSQARHEAKLPDTHSGQVPSAGADSPAPGQQRDWRKRTEELKQQLNAVHSERNSLRKELAAAEEALAEREAQLQAAEAAESREEEDDEALLIGEELEGRQPVRAPIFPPRFLESIGQLPEPVRRELVYTVGGMAAGYAHAIRGTRLLTSRPRFHRQHVGRPYRVILRLTPTELHVVALVNRKDLKRRVESLPL